MENQPSFDDASYVAEDLFSPGALAAKSPAATPNEPSVFAATQLAPAFPDRAAWGTASKLRAWQQEALDRYLQLDPQDFLAVATPGAGKTTFALRIATELLQRGVVQEVTVVCPTEHLKTQWAEAAARVGIQLDPKFRNNQGMTAAGYDGVALTYAQVAMKPHLHAERTDRRKTLVILDEIHHGGDSLSWGDALREAFSHATRRLSLTGTPFRSDTSPIPFVEYETDSQGVQRSRADYTYGYGHALNDHVVRPVMFMSYSGAMRWRTSAGDEVAAQLGTPMTKDMISQAWRTALDPKGQWMPAVLAAADKRLTQLRRGMPDAGGLVIASDQASARSYAKLLEQITRESVVVVLSDDAGSSKRIEDFTQGNQRWMVAVRMVSEGVDVPRLAVGVYATSTQTPLFFAQAVGRFVRARKRGETASVFVPSVPTLLDLAAAMEVERDHVLKRTGGDEDGLDDYLLVAAQKEETEPDADLEETGKFEALDAQATFDRVLYDSQEFGSQAAIGSEEEEDFLGIPGLLEPDQVSTLLRQRQEQQRRRGGAESGVTSVSMHRQLSELRKELHSLVGAWARRKSLPHANVHSQLRRACGGPEVSKATAEEIQQRIDRIREWLVTGK